ncbi:hypothetical protein GJ496_010793 [Pomphorhynchus laevis]|nr:hypothetical protein GJ496_010793 [Pomphorhynchus laevis]
MPAKIAKFRLHSSRQSLYDGELLYDSISVLEHFIQSVDLNHVQDLETCFTVILDMYGSLMLLANNVAVIRNVIHSDLEHLLRPISKSVQVFNDLVLIIRQSRKQIRDDKQIQFNPFSRKTFPAPTFDKNFERKVKYFGSWLMSRIHCEEELNDIIKELNTYQQGGSKQILVRFADDAI